MKDYKPRPKPKKTGSVGNTLVGIFVGLLLGLLIASAIAMYMMRSPFPFLQRDRDSREKASKERVATATKPEPTKSAADKPAKSTEPDRQRFEFYNILTGKQEPKVEDKVAVAPSPRTDPRVPVETFVLQAGSYRNPADADNQKAKLALLGLEANIEPVDLPDRGTWYRVRLGPYRNLNEVNHVRSQLAENSIEATLVRAKESE